MRVVLVLWIVFASSFLEGCGPSNRERTQMLECLNIMKLDYSSCLLALDTTTNQSRKRILEQVLGRGGCPVTAEFIWRIQI
jgi:hypothetical protein